MNHLQSKTKKLEIIVNFTGKFRGDLIMCNFNYRRLTFTPVYLHNFGKYGNHLFIKDLMKTAGDTSCIPTKMETYISVSKKITTEYTDKGGVTKKNRLKLDFLMKFLPKSLDSLVKIG